MEVIELTAGTTGEFMAPARFGKLPHSLSRAITQRHIPCLDALRALGAFLVVFFHLGIPGASGNLGVVIFFVVSGFLITWLLLQEEQKSGRISLQDFYKRRAFRIFPAFYIYIFINITARVLLNADVEVPHAVAAGLYVSNYYQPFWGMPLNGLEHSWSLAIEEQFYLLWPVLFLWLGNKRGRRLQFLLLTIGCIYVYRWVAVWGFHANQLYVFEAFETRADHILVGCLLAILLWEERWLWLWRGLTVNGWRAAFVGIILVALTALHRFVSPETRDTLFLALDPILIAGGLVALLAQSQSVLVAWMERPAVRFLGAISYSVYLYQQAICDFRWFARWPSVSGVLLAIASIVVLAYLSYVAVERPFLRLRNHFLLKGPRSA